MVHFARGETGTGETVGLEELASKMNRLEGDWGALINEYLYHQTKSWEGDNPLSDETPTS